MEIYLAAATCYVHGTTISPPEERFDPPDADKEKSSRDELNEEKIRRKMRGHGTEDRGLARHKSLQLTNGDWLGQRKGHLHGGHVVAKLDVCKLDQRA